MQQLNPTTIKKHTTTFIECTNTPINQHQHNECIL